VPGQALIRGDVGVSALHSLPVDAGATVTKKNNAGALMALLK
jgi:hypothetical protein